MPARKKPTKSPRKSKRSSWSDSIPEVAESIVEVYSSELPRGKKLDYTESSLKTLDRLITDLWGDEGPSDENHETMVWAFGCYVAEVLHRHYNGTWADGSDGLFFDGLESGAGVSPWSWVSKRFEFGSDESIAGKYLFTKKLLSADKKRRDKIT